MTTITFALLDANKDQLFRNQLEILGNVWCLESGISKKQFEKYNKADVHSKRDLSNIIFSVSSKCISNPNLYFSLHYHNG